MTTKHLAIAFVVVLAGGVADSASAQCVPGSVTTLQSEARRDAIRVARLINTTQANQPGRSNGTFLTQESLKERVATQLAQSSDAFLRGLDFTPGSRLFGDWTLTLDVTSSGYWFTIRNEADPCGFAVISNDRGVIFTAEPIR